MAKRTLYDIIMSAYDDVEVCNHVMDEVAKAGTEQKIMSGESVLPHPTDARRHYLRSKGLEGLNEAQIAERSRMLALEQLVMELVEQQKSPDPERAKVIEERVASIREGGR